MAKSEKQAQTSNQNGMYVIVFKPKNNFTTFRYFELGKKKQMQKISGKTLSGSWTTYALLINKNNAYVKRGVLYGNDADVRKVLKKFSIRPKRKRRDLFLAEKID